MVLEAENMEESHDAEIAAHRAVFRYEPKIRLLQPVRAFQSQCAFRLVTFHIVIPDHVPAFVGQEPEFRDGSRVIRHSPVLSPG